MENDDDLIKQQGEDFSMSGDDSEFVIPDEPTDEEYGDEADDLDLSFDDHEDVEDDEIPDLDMPDEDGTDSHNRDDGAEYDDEQHDEEEPKHKIGWKTYTGLALTVVLVAGSLTYFVMPDGSDSRAPDSQNIEQAREIIRQRADEGVQQASAQIPQQETTQIPDQQSGTVDVQPFPDSSGGGANQPPETPVATSNGNNGGNNGGFNNNSFSGNQSVIPDPTERTPNDDQNSRQGLQLSDMHDFVVISDLAKENREKLKSLTGETKGQDSDIGRLEHRVERLERKIDLLLADGGSAKSKSAKDIEEPETPEENTAKKEDAPKKKVSTKKTASKADESDSGPVSYEPKVPKTPAEIKALQRQLAIYGYRPGKVDGVIGGNTRQAVKRLQREHGLPETGWLSGETLLALVAPKHYSGSYREPEPVNFADNPRDEEKHDVTWYVRGVTPNKAVVYRLDGMSYAVAIGTEIPGMGQVTNLDPGKHQVKTAHGMISKRKAD